MAQPCALSVSINLLLLITSFIGSNKSIINDVLSSTKDSPDTFDTKFWGSFDVMLSCVFCWSQYLRVLILSCLSCSIVVIIIVTLMQTDRQSIYGVCHEWLNDAIHGLRGIATQKLLHIRPRGNFMLSDVPVCLPSSCLSSIMIVLINEWWIIAYQSSIISPWLPHRNWGSFVLVERCICVCGSWCGRLCPALWWKDRHIQSKEPWSSFTSHAITHFLYICRL